MIKTTIFLFAIMMFVPMVYAEEFEVDGYVILTNSTEISDIHLSWGNGVLPTGTIHFDKVIDDIIHIQIPKEMPRTIKPQLGNSFYALQSSGHEDQLVVETESDCHYNLAIPVVNSDKIDISPLSFATGTYLTHAFVDCDTIVIVDLPLKTQLESNVETHLINCPNQNHVLAERSDESLVCVYSSSAEKLDWNVVSKRVNSFWPLADELIYFNIRGGIVSDMQNDFHSNSLIVSLDVSQNGSLYVTFPTNLAGNPEDNGFDYFVLVDGEEVDFESSPGVRALKFDIHPGVYDVEIIGAYLVD